ncbi:MAG: adenylyl-sulfate kinase [SAR202 cluster bacterium]|nr:adenylyl-sulfate kinase [SAR202 cluster bacterium]|tara:strand:- start:61282 stop:61893 length:612 start_codon:yes stop_codon:yes gene_type:complete
MSFREYNLDEIRRNLPNLSKPSDTNKTILIILSGLPGTGKSHLANIIADRLPITIIETDFIRRTLFKNPDYSRAENATVFSVCHTLIEELLISNVSVLLDATNLLRKNRKRIYRIAETSNANVILVALTAPQEIVRDRLYQRTVKPDPKNNSSADISVYNKLKETAQPILRQHYIIDSSLDIYPALHKILRKARNMVNRHAIA